MSHNEQEYRATLQRIERFQQQVEQLRKAETNPENYRLSAGGFLAELDRMQLELSGKDDFESMVQSNGTDS